MSIRCGFFNSVNNDRKYNAEDMGRLFEGVISDGIFSTVEPKFKVEPVSETMNLLVNNGKAWFHERYFEIYDPETVTIRQTDINSRIDAICICINTTDSVRAGSIEVIEGSEAETPSKPSIPIEDGIYYIPIAWITIGSNDTVSTDLDITSNIGNTIDPVESYRCPYSEPSLDPRRVTYAYEGDTSVDPIINNQSGFIDIDGTDFNPPVSGSDHVYTIHPHRTQYGGVTYLFKQLNKPMSTDKYIVTMQPQYIIRKSIETGEIVDTIPLDNQSGDSRIREVYAAPRDKDYINIHHINFQTFIPNFNEEVAFIYVVRFYYTCFEVLDDIQQEDQNE